jgi:K+-transporting ATPase ATPase B chain
MAEGRARARADSLRRARAETYAKRLDEPSNYTAYEVLPATSLRRGDYVICTSGDAIPGDGDVVEGIASVDEAAITGESAPVLRGARGDRCAVTGGTRVLSDYLVIRITANPGEALIDRIGLVERARQRRTPNEIAPMILPLDPLDRLPARRRGAAAIRGVQRRPTGSDSRPRRAAPPPLRDDDRR